MMEKEKSIIEYAVLAVIIIAAVVFFLQLKAQDVDFCRRVFVSLVQGRAAVEKYIDWENFKAMGVDVGETYAKIATPKEKQAYKRELIRNLSVGFGRAQGKLDSFAKWRVISSDNEKVIVAADYLGYNKTLLFTISKAGRRIISQIQWRE